MSLLSSLRAKNTCEWFASHECQRGQFWKGLVSTGEGRMAHLVISEHEGMVPAAGCWEWVEAGPGSGSQQGRPAQGGSALDQRSRKGHGAAWTEMLS